MAGLRGKGFTDDFELFGNDLLWIQGKIFLRPTQYRITEAHRFLELSGNQKVAFGIYSHQHLCGGILLNHFKDYSDTLPPIINRKMIQMDCNYMNQPYEYVDVTFKTC